MNARSNFPGKVGTAGEEVLRAVKRRPGMTTNEVAASARLSVEAASRHLRAFLGKGTVTREEVTGDYGRRIFAWRPA